MKINTIEKIVINMGVGDAKENSKFLEGAVKDLELITGAKPVVTKARKSNTLIDVIKYSINNTKTTKL